MFIQYSSFYCSVLQFHIFFFFSSRRRHTRYWRDWSSDVCSSDLGSGEVEEEGFRIIGSHSDSPCFRVKHNPEMSIEGKYLKLNTEVYGGPILSTWFDRALSLAGRVTVKGKDAFHPKSMFVNIEEDFMTIPNLCIHMNRGVNDRRSEEHTSELQS